MQGLVLTLGGCLVALALLWGMLLWAVRFRPRSRPKPGLNGAPMSVGDIVDSFSRKR